MYDIIIVGAGIVGSVIARRLSAFNVNVLVLEKEADISMGSTKANSAIVHGGYAEKHSYLKGRLCYRGRVQYEKLNKELNFGFSPIGSMVLAKDEEQLKGLEKLYENGKANGLDDMEIIGKDRIKTLEKNINDDIKYALYCKGAGVTSPYEMAIAFMENAVKNGVSLKLNTSVEAIEKVGDKFAVKDREGRIYEGSIVINCGGLYSAKIAQMLGINDFSITARSGQYIIMQRGSGSLVSSVLFQMPTKMGKGILVTPTYHGNLLLGPDALDSDSADLSTDVERLISIYEHALETVDKIDPNLFLRSFAGARAVASTDDFMVYHSEVKGFIQCAGIQSPGLTSSPAIADMVVDIVDNELMSLREKKDFDPYREPIIKKKVFAGQAEVMKLISASGPEQLICRCEQVSRGVMEDVISRGLPINTVDAMKRRTRAGMGFCQGQFCGPRVIEFLKDMGIRDVELIRDCEKAGWHRVGRNEFLQELRKRKDRL